MNDDEKYYEFYERVAILLEGNPGMTDDQAWKQAKDELLERREKR